MQTLEQRVARLERSNRRWRYGVALLAFAVVGVAAAKPDTTRRLAVVNDKNVLVAEISATKDGSGQLKLFHNSGKQTVTISAGAAVSEKLTRAGIAVPEDFVRAVVSIHGQLTVDDGSAITSLNGPQVQVFKEPDLTDPRAPPTVERVTLGIFENDGGGFVQVFNPRGKIVAEMQCNRSNAGLIMANDFDGKTVRSLSGSK